MQRRGWPWRTRACWRGAALALLLRPARATTFVVEEATLTLQNHSSALFVQPAQLALAAFGWPPYGSELRGSLMYLDSQAAELECVAPTLQASLPENTFLLVDRGGCTFTAKALHAQALGAAAVVLLDNTVEIEDSLLVPSYDAASPEAQREVDAVKIPVVLARASDGVMLKEVLATERGDAASAPPAALPVALDYTGVVPFQSTRPAWQLWLTSDDSCGRQCARQFETLRALNATAVAWAARNMTEFSVHYPLFYSCAANRARDATCRADCIFGGRYCALGGGGTLGRDVALQNLRSLCVADQGSAAADGGALWWRYALAVQGACSFAAGAFSHQCALVQARLAGVDMSALTACVGQPDADVPNARLEADARARVAPLTSRRGDILESFMPVAVAQRAQFRGTFAPAPLLRFLCASFCADSMPAECPPGLAADPCSDGPSPAPAPATTSTEDTSAAASTTSSSSQAPVIAPAPAPSPASESSTAGDYDASTPGLAPQAAPAPTLPPAQPMPPAAALRPPPPSTAEMQAMEDRQAQTAAEQGAAAGQQLPPPSAPPPTQASHAAGVILGLASAALVTYGGWWWWQKRRAPQLSGREGAYVALGDMGDRTHAAPVDGDDGA